MNHNPKILIATPTYDGMSYCLNEFLKAIKNLTYDNFDIVIGDNSQTDYYSKQIQQITQELNLTNLKVIRSERFNNPRETITNSRNLLRKEFLKTNYDYFFSVEQDVILTPNIIQDLLKHKKEIISGIYYKIQMINEFKVYYPIIMKKFEHEQLNSENNTENLNQNSPNCQVIYFNRNEVEEPQLLEIEVAGLGCILIAKNILEKVQFRFEKNKKAYDDMFFSIDIKKHNFLMFADTSQKCKHLIEGKPDY